MENGDTSTLTIDIGNEDSVGIGDGAQLGITGATLSDPTNYSVAPDHVHGNAGRKCAERLRVFECHLQPAVDRRLFGATLTVETNDGDQVYNHDLRRNQNAELQVTPASAENGTLNLGTVSPGSTTSGSLTTFERRH